MPSYPDLTQRSEDPELMDDLSIGGAELSEALRQLRLINRVLGGARPTLEGVERLWRAAGRPSCLSILDVGAGSGETNPRLLAWADRNKIAMDITLLDINAETCRVAAAYHHAEPRIRAVQGDVFALAPGSADIVTASLFLHHFATAQLAQVVGILARAARIGAVINDLHRHALAWHSIRIATQLLSRNRMIRNDAPLSVQRGFDRADLDHLRADPQLARLRYAWRPLFRWLVLVPTYRVGDDRR